MTIAADPVLDPVGAVVGLVTAADPALDEGAARRAAERADGGRAKRRRLAAALVSDPSVLTTGRSPEPRAVGDLLLALRAAGAAGISPPRCSGCGREVTSMQGRGNHWYCSPCFDRPLACASCGHVRQVASRDRHGRPRCCQCPDQDPRDPRDVLTEIITGADPGLPASAVTAALEAVVTKPAREPAARDEQGRPVCPHCLVTDPANLERCARCGRLRPVSTRLPGGPVCPTCVPQKILACAVCGQARPGMVSKLTGQPWCRGCAQSWAPCSRCGRPGRLRAGTREEPLCGSCAAPGAKWKTCPACGADERLVAGACRRCHLHQRLRDLLADPATGRVRAGLRALQQALAAIERPETALGWLRRPKVSALLAGLAAGQRPLTHAQLERWIGQAVAARPDAGQKEVLHHTGSGMCCDGSAAGTPPTARPLSPVATSAPPRRS